MAQRAYANSFESVATPRSIEFQVLVRITHRIKKAMLARDRNELIAAMHDNRVLWNTFAADVAMPTNALPDDLRARILYLAEFTAHHTRKVLRNEDTAVALLEVNAAILGGLQNEGKTS